MSLRRALSLSYIEKYGSYVIALGTTMIISRILGPADVGAFAIGMAIAGIVAVLREMGISTYIVQEQDLTPERIRTAFTLATLIGGALALLVLGLSVPVGIFYADRRVSVIIAILALGFLTTPFGSISQAIMSREMRFGTLTWIRLLHAIVSSVVAVGLAMYGLGPASLAWATVAAGLVNAVVSLAACPHPMRLNFSPNELTRVLKVGGPTTGIAIVDDLSASLPELVLGRAQSLSQAGIFSRARGLSQMAHQLIARAAGPVFFSAFSALARGGQSEIPLYAKATECITLLGWCFLGALAVMATPITLLLYGPDWLSILLPLRWSCLAGAVLLLTSGAQHLLMAKGGTADVLRAKVWSLPVQLLGVAVGGWWGVEAMAIATVVSSVATSALLCVAVSRRNGIGLGIQLSSLRVSLPIAVACSGGAFAHLLVPSSMTFHPFFAVMAGAAGAGAAGLIALLSSNHPLRHELARAAVSLRGNLAKR